MASTRFTKALAGICIFSLLVAQGCASIPENTRVAVSEEVRNSLTNVGIVSVGPGPEPEALGIIGPVGEIAIGAGKGFLIGGIWGLGLGLLAGIATGGFGGAIVALGIFALGVVGGTTTGAIIAASSTLPIGTAEELETALIDVLSNRDLRVDLNKHILAVPAADSDTKLFDLGMVEETTSLGAEDYQRFAATGVNIALEIGIVQVALFQDEDEETEFALLINTYANLTAVAEQENLWSNEQIVYISPPAAISEWTAPGSDHLRTEIDNGVETLAREISAQVFGTPQ